MRKITLFIFISWLAILLSSCTPKKEIASLHYCGKHGETCLFRLFNLTDDKTMFIVPMYLRKFEMEVPAYAIEELDGGIWKRIDDWHPSNPRGEISDEMDINSCFRLAHESSLEFVIPAPKMTNDWRISVGLEVHSPNSLLRRLLYGEDSSTMFVGVESMTIKGIGHDKQLFPMKGFPIMQMRPSVARNPVQSPLPRRFARHKRVLFPVVPVVMKFYTSGCHAFPGPHDLLGRPVRRIDATPSSTVTNVFSYNARSEVTSAILHSPFVCLHQYESVATGDATNAIEHDAYGNLSRTAHHTCYFVDDNLLEQAYTNRTHYSHRCASFSYDAPGRRASKSSTPYGGHSWLHRYYHSGWLLLLEEVKKGTGLPFEPVHYVWGRDLSGTLDGAGGVGGLLATEVGGVWHFPLYDANGNVTDYVSEAGEVVASYEYDAFGRTLAQSGPMADVFPFRFSTKYYDSETGLYYYGRRYYSPDLGRWLNRDPIEEEGGVNLYAFCGNNGVFALTLRSKKNSKN